MMEFNKRENSSPVSRIVELLWKRARDVRVQDVRIGLGYTAVLLEDNRAGVAYTFRDEAEGGCTVLHALRPIAGRPASDLLELLNSQNRIEAAVGLASANALTNQDSKEFQTGDILKQLDLKSDDHVGMVGHFAPLVNALKERASKLTIFERIAEASGNLRPVSEITAVLPECQIALITATSIINHTIDGLLAAAEGCREVVVLGASTPMLRAAFTDSNVSMLSGVVIEQPSKVLRVVSEAGGMRLFKPYVRKVNLPV